jgi:non-ribosomal peptide synthetase component F
MSSVVLLVQGHRSVAAWIGRTAISFLAVAAYGLPTALAGERAGDTSSLDEFVQHANAVTALEAQFLSLIDSASTEEKFFLYWTYNHLTDARLQVEYLKTQLEISLAAESDADEASARTTLRDQAQFVRRELGNTIEDLEQNTPEVRRFTHLWINEALRRALSEMRATVNRLWAEQCARTTCVADP